MPDNRPIDASTEWADPFNLYSGNKSPGGGKTASPLPSGMSQRDWDDTVNTVIAEAAGEGDDGMAGVAHVIRNRSNIRGKSIGDVVREPDQFTGYSAPGAKTVEAMRDPAMRARAEGILRNVLTSDGPDPTDGADHYHTKAVSPSWAASMPQTTTIGEHIYYNSKGEKKASPPAATAFVAENDELGLYGPKGQFRDLLQGDEGKGSTVPNPNGKGLARLVREPEDAPLGTGGKLNFVHAGQDKINPQFASILSETSKAMGRDFTINSGYRSPSHRVEAAKPGGPGEHSTGTASDISMKGMSIEERQQLVRELRSRGAMRFIAYSSSPDMLHVDMKDQTGNGAPWFMFDKSNRNLGKAPAWFQEIAANPGQPAKPQQLEAIDTFGLYADRAKPTQADLRPFQENEERPNSDGSVSTEVSTTWKLPDGKWVNVPSLWMGRGGPKQFASDDEDAILGTMREYEAKNGPTFQRFDTEEDAVAAAKDRSAAGGAASGDAAQRAYEEREAKTPGKYALLTESEAAERQKTWEKKNRSSGTAGDLVRVLGAAAADASQSLDNLGNLLLNKVPGGTYINDTLESIDRWMGGGTTVAEKRQESADRQMASLSPQGQISEPKKWWDDVNKTLGPAWTDPRSYLFAIAKSAPSTVASMVPAGIIARGAFLSTLAGGASREVAAATAAKTATLAGGITEGLLGGADAANSVRQKIAEMPREQLVQSDAVKQLIDSGMSEQQAIDAVSNDAQTQALITAGVVTGAFGGMGDRALAKIIAEGVEGGVARRVATGAARGAIAEGLLEEAPQSAGQTIAENAAMRRVNPDQELTEGLGESVASGIAAGGAMGGGMGGAGGLVRPARNTASGTVPTEQASEPTLSQPEPDNRGPLRRAADHGQQRETERVNAANSGAPIDGRPAAKSTVRVEADGIEPFMGTVEGYEGGEAIIVDSGSGEMFQVPIANIKEIAPPVGDYRFPENADDGMPELSADPALEPLAPMGSETTSEMPPRSEDMAATDKRPTRPQPGHRVIVDSPEAGRFPARIERYENGGAEVLVTDDSGKSYQVPIEAARVNSLTIAQVEAQDLERNPPIEREIGDAGPNSRKIGDKTVVLPDENHAALYDLAREQVMAKRLGGTSQVDIDNVLPAERKRLADAFGIKVADLASMADDYRYRAERAAKEAKSKLPVKMHAVNDRLLKQRQAALAKEAGEPLVQPTDDGAQWWETGLTDPERKSILAEAGVKRPERTPWASMTPGIKKKLLDVRDAQRAAADDVATLASEDEVSAKMRALADEIGQDDGAVFPDHAEAMRADAAANEAATSPTNDLPEPTAAQKEAGNYKVGRLKLGGLDISIENPAGSQRKGVSSSGKAWSVDMKSHYGYIRGTVGRDKDHIDVFVRPGTETLDDSSPIFVVDQKDPARGRFDEHKVMAGFDNEAQARAAYLENYTADWKGLGDISRTTLGDFKTWLKSGKTSEPFAPKRFASKEKADGYVDRNKMGETHEVVQRGKRFEILERSRTTPPVQSSKGTDLDPSAYPWADVWGSDADAISDALGRIAEVNGGDTPISDAVKANVSNKELLELIQQHWGEGGAGGNRYMIETRKGPVVTVTLEKDDGNKRVVLRGKDLADAIRKEFAVSLEDMRQAAEARAGSSQQRGEVVTDRAGRKYEAKGEKLPQKGLAPANIGADGKVYVGAVGSQHFVIADKHHEAAPFDSVGFVTPDGEFLSRTQAFEWVNTNEKPVRTGSNMSGELDALDYKDQVPAAARAGKGTEKASSADKNNGSSDTTLPATNKPDRKADILAKLGADVGDLVETYGEGRDMQGGQTFTVASIASDGAVTLTTPRSRMPLTLSRKELDAEIKAGLSFRKVDNTAPAGSRAAAAAKAKPNVSANTIFTDDAAAKARELLRKKLSGNTLNSGIDPELLQAGITLAGYHIEKGARTFAAYASAMLADLGEGARPYLKSWYAATVLDPRFSDIEGMTPLAELADINVDAISAQQPKKVDEKNEDDAPSQGPFGPILRGYEGKWREAALELERRQTGDAIGALSHPDVGPIDLVWGRPGNNQHDGSGLAKLIAWHPEVLQDLQGFIDGLHVDPASRTERRIQLVSDNGRAGIRLDYDGNAKTWLLTAYDAAAPRRTERSSRRFSEIWAGRSTPASSGKSAGKSARSDTASTNLSDAIASRQTSTDENIALSPTDVQSPTRPKPHETRADGYDRPAGSKRQDIPVEGTRNDLQHVGLPSAPEGAAIFDWARDTINRFGKKGHEYLMAVDDDGTVVEFGTAKRKASTGINNKLLGAMLNPDRRLVVFHNHPRGGPLSADDIAMLALPGMQSVWSFAPSGADMRAALTPAAETALFSAPDHFEKMREISSAIADARNDVSDFLAEKVRDGTVKPEEAEQAHNFASVLVAHRAGLIDITSEKNYNAAAIDGLNSRLDSAAAAIRESIDDGKTSYPNQRVSRRSARDFRHVAEVAGLARRGERVASGRSGPEGLSEAGPSNYQGEVGEWRKLVRDFSDVKATRENIVSRLRGVITDNKSGILATVPLNYFPELAGDKLPAINDYLLIKRKMDAYRSGRHDAAAEVMDRWRKYISTGFLAVDKSKAQALADLMHDATLAGIDPALTTEEERAKPGYERLRKRFTSIAPIGQKLFTDVRDAYREQADELDRLLLDNVRKAQEMAKQQAEREFKARLADIEASDLNPIDRRRRVEEAQNKHKAAMTKSTWASKARMTQLRVMFESNRVPDPYFPLARFGDYFVSVKTPRKDEAGDIVGYDVLHFSRHEKARQMEQALSELRNEFPDAIVTSGMLSKGGELKSAMDPRVVGELDKLLASANVSDDIRDALYQRWLQTMPDLSMRKRAIHRKGVAGYNTDAFRVFASTTFHAAHQMARLKYGLELQENVNLAEEQAKGIDHNQKEMALVNELFKRHQWTLNPTTKPLTNWITGAAFVYFLGATPAAALVNASQTIMVGVPVLSAKFGFARSSSELVKATREFTDAVIKETKTARGLGDFFKNAGDLRNASSLTSDERAAMEAFYESGLIDRTQSHDLAAVGETGTTYNPMREKVMNFISYGFHKVEVFNRTVTAIAAYRLAREAGQSHLDAINVAHDLTYKTHFDMSNSSRPRVTQGDIPRLATMFRSFQINMLYRLFRDVHQSVKGESRQVRREARLQLAGVTGMMALNAGLTGTVGYGLAMAAGGILKSMFGDDDDPLEFEERFRSDILELLGPELGGIVLKGVPGHYLGIDLTSRIGMPDLWWRSESRELNSDDALKEFVYQNLGAGFGIVRNTYNGVDLALQGNVERGVETAAPKFIRDLLRFRRYASDGVESIRGDQVIAPDDLSAWNLASQAMGFTPAKIADAYEVNTILRNAEQRIRDRKRSIVNRFAKAVEDGDDEARQTAIEDIEKYNAGTATRLDPITANGLKQSLRMRVRNRQRSVGGVLIRNEALNQYLRGEVAGASGSGDDEDVEESDDE